MAIILSLAVPQWPSWVAVTEPIRPQSQKSLVQLLRDAYVEQCPLQNKSLTSGLDDFDMCPGGWLAPPHTSLKITVMVVLHINNSWHFWCLINDTSMAYILIPEVLQSIACSWHHGVHSPEQGRSQENTWLHLNFKKVNRINQMINILELEWGWGMGSEAL